MDGFLPGPLADELRSFVLEQHSAGKLRVGSNAHEGPAATNGHLEDREDFWGPGVMFGCAFAYRSCCGSCPSDSKWSPLDVACVYSYMFLLISASSMGSR